MLGGTGAPGGNPHSMGRTCKLTHTERLRPNLDLNPQTCCCVVKMLTTGLIEVGLLCYILHRPARPHFLSNCCTLRGDQSWAAGHNLQYFTRKRGGALCLHQWCLVLKHSQRWWTMFPGCQKSLSLWRCQPCYHINILMLPFTFNLKRNAWLILFILYPIQVSI